MGRTISARLSEAEIEALDALAKQNGVSRSQLLTSIARQAVNAEARHPVDNVNNEDIEGKQFPDNVDDQTKQLLENVDIKGFLEDEAVHNVFVELPRPFTCPECGETSGCATLCPVCGKLELHGCKDDCPTIRRGWLLSEMYHPIKVD